MTYLDRFLTFCVDVAAVYPGSHILHDDWARAAVDEDTRLCVSLP